jgi:hypothetical protein
MSSRAEYLNWRMKQWLHSRVARGVLETPPVATRQDGVILFSMLGAKGLLPFLVAAKTLQSWLGRGRFVILDDGSLTPRDRALLASHLGDPEILSIHDVDTGPCPRGGTWERLLTLLDLRANAYVIQFDSDTITCGPLPEVAAAIDERRSFTLLGEAGAELLAFDAFVASRAASSRGSGAVHVQAAIEALIDRVAIPGLAEPRYVRGCAGFAGFAPASSGRALAEAFSIEAERLVGRDRWAEWGSEQVTSNIVVANEPDPILLPYGRYLNFWDQELPADRRFVHFIGTCRFRSGVYVDETRAAIAALRGPAEVHLPARPHAEPARSGG